MRDGISTKAFTVNMYGLFVGIETEGNIWEEFFSSGVLHLLNSLHDSMVSVDTIIAFKRKQKHSRLTCSGLVLSFNI